MYKATEEEIAGWKAKFGKVFKLSVSRNETEVYDAYLKNPDRKVLGAATATGGNDQIKTNEIILKNCWLAGDEEIKTADDLFLGASAQLGKIINIAQGELQEL
jgi:hypothetical protein